MKKEWTFNYFVKAEPDKNKAHVPEKHCGLNLWNSFIGNSMLIKKIGLIQKLILVKNVANNFSIQFFELIYIFLYSYLYWSLGAVFYMFGFHLWKYVFKQFNIEKMSMIFLNFSTNYLLVLLIGNPSAIVARQPIF